MSRMWIACGVVVGVCTLSVGGEWLLERRARDAFLEEGRLGVRRLYDASIAYYSEEHAGQNGSILARQFPAPVGLTPNRPPDDGEAHRYRDDDWDSPTWKALTFVGPGTQPLRYAYFSGGTGDDAWFKARAVGRLDGALHVLERAGFIGQTREEGGHLLHAVLEEHASQ